MEPRLYPRARIHYECQDEASVSLRHWDDCAVRHGSQTDRRTGARRMTRSACAFLGVECNVTGSPCDACSSAGDLFVL